MNVWRLFMYPITAPFHGGNAPRALAIGGPFFVLAALGLVYPLRHRYVNGLRAGVVASFVFWFVPLELDRLPLHELRLRGAVHDLRRLPRGADAAGALAAAARLAARARGGGGASGRGAPRRLLPLLPRRPARGEAVLRRQPDQHLAEARPREPAHLPVLRAAARHPRHAGVHGGRRRQAAVPQGGGLQVRGLAAPRAPDGQRPVQGRGHARARRRRASTSAARSGRPARLRLGRARWTRSASATCSRRRATVLHRRCAR